MAKKSKKSKPRRSTRSGLRPKAQEKTSAVSQEEIPLKKTKIRVFGIGGGGSSIISEIALRVKKATFVAVNTDRKALGEVNKNITHFQFGESFTHGLGTGMNAETGEMAALSEKERIKKLFEGQDLCIFVTCLGGGTGTGATKVFAKMAKASGCLTYGIFTLPFNFEGEKKTTIAREALEDLKQKLHAYSVIPNERIFQIIQKETPLREALSVINGKLAASLEGLIEIIYEPGLINIDFADLKAILEGQGRLTYLNTVEVRKKEGAVQEEIDKLLNSQLYPYGIKGARGVLYNIAGEKGLSLLEVSQISKSISDLVNKEAKIIFGISQNQKYRGIIKTTLLATGCGTKIFSDEQPRRLVAGVPKPTPKAALRSDVGAETPEKREKTSRPVKRKSPKPKSKTTKKRSGEKNSPAGRQGKRIKIKVVAQNEGPKIDKTTAPMFPEVKAEAKIRKNALQIRAESDRQEAEMLAKEKVWETPAFLRRKKIV